jgi:hypothetical protein
MGLSFFYKSEDSSMSLKMIVFALTSLYGDSRIISDWKSSDFLPSCIGVGFNMKGLK